MSTILNEPGGKPAQQFKPIGMAPGDPGVKEGEDREEEDV
jgi:hypothetical protein